MKFDFKNKLVCIFGLHESGKTVLAKHIAKQYKTVVFDILGEYKEKGLDWYEPKHTAYPDVAQDFDIFLKNARTETKWNMILLDEASTVFPNKRGLMPIANNFINFYRHSIKEKGWNKGAMFICRRPARLNTDIVELSRYLIIFQLKGKNDIQYLNSINEGLGDAVVELDGYEFIVVQPNRTYKKYPAIKLTEK